MQFKVLAIISFAAAVMAAPSENHTPSPPPPPPAAPASSTTTLNQAVTACGSNLTVSCCNKSVQTGDSTNVAKGFLAGILGDEFSGAGFGLFDGCSKVDIPVAVPGGAVSDLLSNNCKATPACCQNSDLEQKGYINFGIPCVALSSIV